MIDIEKQITYWRDSAIEDWQVAQDLIRQGRIRHGFFFVHLSIEKLLKAHVCKQTQDLAPRIHNLLQLAEKAGLETDQTQKYVLGEVNSFNLVGRYPEMLTPVPSEEQAKVYLERANWVYQWLTNRL